MFHWVVNAPLAFLKSHFFSLLLKLHSFWFLTKRTPNQGISNITFSEKSNWNHHITKFQKATHFIVSDLKTKTLFLENMFQVTYYDQINARVS